MKSRKTSAQASSLQRIATIVSIVVGVGGLALGVWQARMTQKMLSERKAAS
ncbi:MAG: hypothetical protein JSS89_12160 [Bacteroidetes bacterium]|nr:hypothetical protein [Bacteroidota bacterium]